MKKTLLALAITTLSANAFAANLNYALPNQVVNTVATEVAPATNISLTTTSTIAWPVGFSVTDQNLIRLDLPNGAKFTANPTVMVGASATTISAGGANNSYVILQLAVGASQPSTAQVVVTLAGLTLPTQTDVTIGYKLFSNQPDAVANNGNTVASGSYPYSKFGSALVFAAATGASAASKQIDVTTGNKLFTNGTATSTAFGGLNLAANANTYGLTIGSTPLTLTNLIGTTATITVSGSFNAISGTPGDTKLDVIGASAVNVAKTAVTFPLGAVPPTLSAAKLTYAATGTTVIDESVFNAKLTLGTGAQLLAAPADVTGVANLAKSGATAFVDLALKPGGTYSNYVRISNKSSIAGKVFMTVINDDGQSATFNLNDVAGQPASLAAGASTTQMTIQDIFNAAAAKGLALSGDGKLRLVVDAEITNNQLSVQTYTVSKDGNSFAEFN